MAKDKDKKGSGKKGKKDGGKKAAGIKIPKPLRKAGKEALKLASEPVVSEIVAAALLSAAAALRGDKAGKSGAAAAGAAGEAAGNAERQSSKLGDSMRALALDLARKTLDNWERPAAATGGAGKGGKGNGGGGSAAKRG